MNLKLYNTLTRQKEEFRPIKKNLVGLYTCGPTVYDYDHLGHAWNYFVADILRRVLEYNGYKVKHVMNITDVGHLTSDADFGEDKMEKSAAAAGKTAYEIAEFFTKIYLQNRQKLNFLKPKIICKATDHIPEMIKLVKILLEKDFVYKISDGIYFDTTKFPAYGQLSGNTLEQLKAGARVEVNPEKRDPTDFALWKFSPAGSKRQMEWQAFGKQGFPGWHLECSAMSMRYLGKHFDLHTGGEDNIFPHHESEIAQSEAATGEKFVNFWLHTRFLLVEGEKMSKSKNNFYTLADLEKKGFFPLDLRYLFLQTHYRQKLNFTWEGLKAAQQGLKNLREAAGNRTDPPSSPPNRRGLRGASRTNRTKGVEYEEKFLAAINDDLNTSQALAVVWKLVKDEAMSPAVKKNVLLKFDQVLGLDLAKAEAVKVPKAVQNLVRQREGARAAKDWERADKLRQQVRGRGFEIEDQAAGTAVRKI